MINPVMSEQLLSHIDEKSIVDLCSQLIRLKSVNPPGNEHDAARYSADYLAEAGLEVELITHTPERASVLARLKGSGELPGIMFTGHLDTVPVGAEKWLYDPFAGEVSEGRVWGRGTCDMKGGDAAIMVALKALAASGVQLKGDVVLALTAGEEADSLGAVTIARRTDLGPLQALVVAEPSSNDIYVAEKGALWLEITTHGKTAHGSMPHLGKNAVLMMVTLLNELQLMKIPFEVHPMLGDFSMSINTINGGVKTNVVPDYCEITIDMRTVPSQDHQAIYAQFNGLIEKLAQADPDFKASIKIINDRIPITTDPDNPMVKAFNRALGQVLGQETTPKGVRYYTDAAALSPAFNLPMIICGPGEAGMAHQPNEYVDIDKMVQATRIYALACLEILG